MRNAWLYGFTRLLHRDEGRINAIQHSSSVSQPPCFPREILAPRLGARGAIAKLQQRLSASPRISPGGPTPPAQFNAYSPRTLGQAPRNLRPQDEDAAATRRSTPGAGARKMKTPRRQDDATTVEAVTREMKTPQRQEEATPVEDETPEPKMPRRQDEAPPSGPGPPS